MSTRRDLSESYSIDPKTVTVDEQNHVIKNVRVLGGESKNRYGISGSEGTEYTDAAMKAALPLYENVTVFADHPDKRNPSAERGTREAVGKIRGVRFQPGEIRGDLHYRPSSDTAQALVDDVKLGLGIYALSHNAASDRERFDKQKRKLLIESIALVRSVDVVTRGATNRNLAESTEVSKITFRSLLESDKKRFSKGRQSWLTRLLEMDDMGSPMDAPTDAPEAETDPDEALKGGFKAAVLAVVEQALSGDMPSADALKKIKELLTTHEKLNADDEPAEPTEPDGDEGDTGASPDKAESLESLQAELKSLKTREAVRSLCESEKFTPTALQIKTLALLESDGERKELIASWSAATTAATATATPAKAKSISPGMLRNVRESQSTETETPVLKPADALAKLRS